MSTTSFHDGRVTLHAGDCVERIRDIPDASIDSVVTDPPYALVSIVKRFGKAGSAPGTVLFWAEAGTVSITADNLDMRVSVPLETEHSENGCAAVSGQLLSEIVKRCRKGKVQLSVAADKCSISSGTSRFTLSTLPPDTFPDLFSHDWSAGCDIDGEALRIALGHCLASVCTDAAYSYLNGVHVRATPSGLSLASTNVHTLTVSDLACESDPQMSGFTVPAGAAGEIARLCDSGPVTLRICSGAIQATFPNGVSLTSKLIDGTFPDYERLIPRNENVILADRAEFDECLSRVAVIAGDKERAAKFTFAPDQSSVSVKYTDQGAPREAHDDLHAEVSNSVEIGLNASYVRAALSTIGSEIVEIRLKDNVTPAIFVPQGRERPLCLISPLRV